MEMDDFVEFESRSNDLKDWEHFWDEIERIKGENTHDKKCESGNKVEKE